MKTVTKQRINLVKAFSLFLVIAISGCIFANLPLSALAEGAIGELWVAGVQVTEENAGDILGDGTAFYNFENNTLTLKNANITNALDDNDGLFGIYSEGGLNIALEGENKIEIPEGNIDSYGIYVEGDLHLSGDSVLIKNGNTANIPGGVDFVENVAIYATGKITVSGAKAELFAGNVDAPDGIIAYSEGVFTQGAIEIKDGGNLFAFGGDVTGNASFAASMGIEAYGAEDSLVYVAVNDGGITGTGGEVVSKETSISNGIYILYGDMLATSNDSFLSFEGGNATAVSNDGVKTGACSNGAYISGGNFGAVGGNIHFTAKECVADVVYGDALKVEYEIVHEEAYGGIVIIDCVDVHPTSYGYGFVGTNVEFKSECGLAIYAEFGIEISDNLVISSPEEGYTFMGDGENLYYTIMDKDENEVSRAKIEVLTHKVYINDAERKLSVLVADKMSINEIYSEKMGVEDFAEYLITEKEGYVFEGWYYDEEFTKEFSFDDSIESTLTVYGKWTKVTDDPSGDIPKPGDGGKTVFCVLAFVSLAVVTLLVKKQKRA